MIKTMVVRLGCLAVLCAVFSLSGCSPQESTKINVEKPPSTATPDPSAITQNPRTFTQNRRAARTMTELFNDIDTDVSGVIDDEELRMANLYCGRWFPADREFVEELYANMAKYGHVIKAELVTPPGPTKTSISVNRLGITAKEFEKAWQALRAPDTTVKGADGKTP